LSVAERIVGADPVRDRPVAAREIRSALTNLLDALRDRRALGESDDRAWQIAAKPDVEDFLRRPYDTIHWTVENPRFDAATGAATVVVHINFVGATIAPAPPQPFDVRVTRDEGPWRVLSFQPGRTSGS
jgi:hypothetical protein